MTSINELRPTSKPNVIDLLNEAGVNVKDWANFKGGITKAASNPKYCYEWSFLEVNKVIVLNLWFSGLRKYNGKIFRKYNMRALSSKLVEPVSKRRALSVDENLKTAISNKLPVRVIINDGDTRVPEKKVSRVKKRMLDNMPWTITSYNNKTGECVLTRGVDPDRYVDQFSIDDGSEIENYPEKIIRKTSTYKRDANVRKRVLSRAIGKCELCGKPGFVMSNGNIYLETHHVVPLSEDGPDNINNVVAICPNHHREAHHGISRMDIREKLLKTFN